MAIPSETLDLVDESTILLLNKSDAVEPLSGDELKQQVSEVLARAGKSIYGQPVVASVRSQTGLVDLETVLSGALGDLFCLDESEWPLITQQRHRVALEECAEYLRAYKGALRILSKNVGMTPCRHGRERHSSGGRGVALRIFCSWQNYRRC